MRAKLISACLVLLTVFSSERALAEQVHQCTGEAGENLYTERPCGRPDGDYGIGPAAAASDRLMEQTRLEIVSVKRQLMDVSRERSFLAGDYQGRERAEFLKEIEARTRSLEDRLMALEAEYSELMARRISLIVDDQKS